MSAVSIKSIISDIETEINSFLSVYPRKKIIFTGKTNDLKSIGIVTPESSLNTNEKGLVDFTQIQKSILDTFDIALVIFRLTNGEVFNVDYQKLKLYLTDENMTFNERAFEHWKLHIYPSEQIITIKEKNNSVPMERNFKYLVQSTSIVYPDDISEDILFEGAKKKVTVNFYERDPNARKACLEHYGYNCYICQFNFEKNFEEIGKNFIHVHHIKPLSEINKEYKVNPIKDLIPVCPNCHAMLHKKVPAYSLKELKDIIKKTHNKT